MISKALLRVWVLFTLAISGAGAAGAQNFDFSYTASGVNVMGTFVTTSQGNGNYLINSIINGMRGGNVITLLAPGSVRSTGTAFNDNILKFPANPAYFDINGFGYTSSGVNYNGFYFSQNAAYYEQSNNNFANVAGVVVAAAGVPAPLPGGGLLSFLALGLAGLTYRRRAILARSRDILARFGKGPVVGPA